MTGAKELDPKILTGEILLNMDTEEDDELTIGCAGGVDTTVALNYKPEISSCKTFEVVVKGLKGGHSGMDIDKGLGNANLILADLLGELEQKISDFILVEIDGGGLRNAIPREAKAIVGSDYTDQIKRIISTYEEKQKAEFSANEPNLVIQCGELGKSEVGAVPKDITVSLLRAISKIPNGVYAMSKEIDDLVETSSNLARVFVKEGSIELLSLQRSSVESGKNAVAGEFRKVFESIGAEVVHSGDYPGWEPLLGSPIVQTMKDIYIDLFKTEPKVMACHAGLECGIIGERYPNLEMVSYGPTIRGAHSPDERVSISSVQKFWNWTLQTLKNIPEKD
jgi:dipeptidase D